MCYAPVKSVKKRSRKKEEYCNEDANKAQPYYLVVELKNLIKLSSNDRVSTV